jgi:hypothetical protein
MGMEANDNAGAAPESTSGDFGEGTGSLEQQLLDSLPKDGEKPEDGKTDEGEAAAVVPAEGGVAQVATAPLFDINGKVSVKVGQPLTADHVKELERGWLREADYTRKTQDLAKKNSEAQTVLDAQASILKDPRNIFQHMKPEQVLSAFTRQEMLSHGLNAAGVSPQLWNQFIDWKKSGGTKAEPGEEVNGGNADAKDLPKVDPHSQRLEEFSRKLEAIERRDMTRAEKEKSDREKNEAESQMSKYDAEVDAAIKDFPGLNKRLLLVELAASDGSKTIKELAQEMHGALESKFQEYLKTKTKTKEEVIRSPKGGSSVALTRKAPKSWEEADDAIAKVYGNGQLKGGAAFGE